MGRSSEVWQGFLAGARTLWRWVWGERPRPFSETLVRVVENGLRASQAPRWSEARRPSGKARAEDREAKPGAGGTGDVGSGDYRFSADESSVALTHRQPGMESPLGGLMGQAGLDLALDVEALRATRWLRSLAVGHFPNLVRQFSASAPGLDPFAFWGLPTPASLLAVGQAAAEEALLRRVETLEEAAASRPRRFWARPRPRVQLEDVLAHLREHRPARDSRVAALLRVREARVWGTCEDLLASGYPGQAPVPFCARDLKDAGNLASRLRDATDDPSHYLSGQLSAETQRLVAAHDGLGEASEELREALVADLNRVLDGPGLHEQADFRLVAARPHVHAEVESLALDLPRLNRRILEEAFPAELARAHRAFPLRVADLIVLAGVISHFRDWHYWPRLVGREPLLALFYLPLQFERPLAPYFGRLGSELSGESWWRERTLWPDLLQEGMERMSAWRARGSGELAYARLADLSRLLGYRAACLVRAAADGPMAPRVFAERLVLAYARALGMQDLLPASLLSGSELLAMDFFGAFFQQLAFGLRERRTMVQYLEDHKLLDLARRWHKCLALYATEYGARGAGPARGPFAGLPWAFPEHLRLVPQSAVGDDDTVATGLFRADDDEDSE